jgi:hypothetical protein
VCVGRTTIHQLWYDPEVEEEDNAVPHSGFLITRDIARVIGADDRFTVAIAKQPERISIDGTDVSPGIGAPVRIEFTMRWTGRYLQVVPG